MKKDELSIVRGGAKRARTNVVDLEKMKRVIEVGDALDLGEPCSDEFDLGELVMCIGKTAEADGLDPKKVLVGLAVGVRRYALDRGLVKESDIPPEMPK